MSDSRNPNHVIDNVTYGSNPQQQRQAQVTLRPHLSIANIRKAIDSGWDVYYHIGAGSRILIVLQPQKRNIYAVCDMPTNNFWFVNHEPG